MKYLNKYEHVVVGCMPIILVVKVQEIREPYDERDMPYTNNLKLYFSFMALAKMENNFSLLNFVYVFERWILCVTAYVLGLSIDDINISFNWSTRSILLCMCAHFGSNNLETLSLKMICTHTMCTPLKLDNAASSFLKSYPFGLYMYVCGSVVCPFMYLTTSKPVKYVKRKIVAEYKKAHTPMYTEVGDGKRN